MVTQTTQPHYPTPKAERQRPKAQPPKKKWLPYLLFGGFAVGASTMAACVLSLLMVFMFTSNRVPSGVSVAGIGVGGASLDSARQILEGTLASTTVNLGDGDRSQDLSLAQLGISLDLAATLEQAQQARPGTNLTPVYQIDLVQAQSALIELSEGINLDALVGEAGRALEIPVLLDRLRSNLAVEIADGYIDLPMIEIAPLEPEKLTAENYSGPMTTHIVERGQELGLISKQYDVSIADLVSMNGIENADLLYIGQELMIPAAGEYIPSIAEAPAPSTTIGKALVVSVNTQRIYAYENGALVHSHLVSTGLPRTPTVLGDYKIYVKYQADDMSGPDYFLPQVPNTMYFYQGYAIHGTYWHNSFGRPMSHGCVNLPVDESSWFFNWAQVGTPVRVVA